jgi:hypothetical protein
MSDVKFSPAQERLLRVLGDGLLHSKHDLCKAARVSSENSLCVQLSMLRRKLLKIDPEIAVIHVVAYDIPSFRLVRLQFLTLDDLKDVKVIIGRKQSERG